MVLRISFYTKKKKEMEFVSKPLIWLSIECAAKRKEKSEGEGGEEKRGGRRVCKEKWKEGKKQKPKGERIHWEGIFYSITTPFTSLFFFPFHNSASLPARSDTALSSFGRRTASLTNSSTSPPAAAAPPPPLLTGDGTYAS